VILKRDGESQSDLLIAEQEDYININF